MNDEDLDNVIGTNLSSAYVCAQLAGRQMIGQGRGGSIIPHLVSLEPHRRMGAASPDGAMPATVHPKAASTSSSGSSPRNGELTASG